MGSLRDATSISIDTAFGKGTPSCGRSYNIFLEKDFHTAHTVQSQAFGDAFKHLTIGNLEKDKKNQQKNNQSQYWLTAIKSNDITSLIQQRSQKYELLFFFFLIYRFR